MKINQAIIVVCLFFVESVISGCAQHSGTITKAAASFIVFTGDPAGAKATIDGRAFELTKDIARSHFELAPGIHRIKIEKLGQIVVDRELLLSDRQTIEVAIP